MKTFHLNGVERDLPLSQEDSLEKLLDLVRKNFVNDTAWISTIRVDGSDLTDAEESPLFGKQLSDLESLEVFTAHPREIAEETLQTLILFTPQLESLSNIAANAIAAGGGAAEVTRLIDGISVFTDSISTVKQVLRLGSFRPTDILEADLLSILKDILSAFQTQDRKYLEDLLREHLPKNLAEWHDTGLPAIIRSRDS